MDPWQRKIRSVLRLDLTSAGRYAYGKRGVIYASICRGVGLKLSSSAHAAMAKRCERQECVWGGDVEQLITINLGNIGRIKR